MYNVMIVEDNEIIRNELSTFLKKNGYNTLLVTDFAAVLSFFNNHAVDCVLLDLSLPDVDGYFIAREIRKISTVPIVVVTSRDSTLDEVMAMTIGADDFITKPYNLPVLLARLQSVLRRSFETNEPQVSVVKGVSLDVPRGTVSYEGQTQSLSKNELGILSFLFEHKNTIVARDDLMTYLWNTDWYVDDNTLTVNVNRLRKKLEEIGIYHLIETKRGMGYTIHES